MSSEDTPPNLEQLTHVIDSEVLHRSMLRSLSHKMSIKGEVVMPCVPSMLDHYMLWLEKLFLMLGKPIPEEVQDHLRQLLAKHLDEGFQAERHSEVVFRYEPSDKSPYGVDCTIGTRVSSIAEEYSKWVETRKPPLFGAHPDAKVMAVAALVSDQAQVQILDVGAGTGRNTLPLARLGHPVDALEVTPAFAEQIRAAAEAEGLPVTVIECNVLDPQVKMGSRDYRLAIASEVISDFRSVEQLRVFLCKMCTLLSSGSLLLFNIFLAVDEYEPDRVARDVSQVMISSIFTRKELAAAMHELPLELVSDESVYEYERAHLPAEAWPPISWYVNWTTGRNVFPLDDDEGKPPIELRWMLYRCYQKCSNE